MNCKKIQDLVLTDYSDGQLAEKLTRQVEDHLAGCASCRLLAQNVRQNAIAPLKKKDAGNVYDVMWRRIKDKIQDEEAAAALRPSPVEVLQGFLHSFRPAVVMACLFVVLGVTWTVRHNLVQQEPYLAYVMDADTQGDEVTDGVEQYFL